MLLWLLLVLPALAQEHIDRLLNLMQQRLALAPTVAQVKWNNHLPVDDPVREQQLLDAIPPLPGVDPERARSFLQAQFEASKSVQLQCRQNWVGQHSGSFPQAPSLGEIRPQLDKITSEMLQALAEAQPELGQAGLLEKSLARFPENEAWNRALEPLR